MGMFLMPFDESKRMSWICCFGLSLTGDLTQLETFKHRKKVGKTYVLPHN